MLFLFLFLLLLLLLFLFLFLLQWWMQHSGLLTAALLPQAAWNPSLLEL